MQMNLALPLLCLLVAVHQINAECCSPVNGDTCGDCTPEPPFGCCSYFSCNIFCCNCDSGYHEGSV